MHNSQSIDATTRESTRHLHQRRKALSSQLTKKSIEFQLRLSTCPPFYRQVRSSPSNRNVNHLPSNATSRCGTYHLKAGRQLRWYLAPRPATSRAASSFHLPYLLHCISLPLFHVQQVQTATEKKHRPSCRKTRISVSAVPPNIYKNTPSPSQISYTASDASCRPATAVVILLYCCLLFRDLVLLPLVRCLLPRHNNNPSRMPSSFKPYDTSIHMFTLCIHRCGLLTM